MDALITSANMTVFCTLDTEKSQIEGVISDVKKMDDVESVTYITHEQAFARYRDYNKDNPLLLEQVSAELLPITNIRNATMPYTCFH